MKRFIKLFLFSVFLNLVFICNTKAEECSYNVKAMLMQDAAKVHIHKEETGMYLNVIIEGLSNNLYIRTSTRNYNDDDTVKFQEYIYGSQGEKQIILWTNTKSVYDITFEVYAGGTTSCPNEKLNTIKLTLPMYNSYHQNARCTDNQDKYVCNSFVTSTISEEEFNRAFEGNTSIDVDDDEKKANKYKESTLEKFFKENKTFIILGACLVTFGVVTGIVLYKRKNRLY